MRRAFWILLVASILILSACDSAGSGGGDDEGYQEISLNTDYVDQSIPADGKRYYTFVAGGSANHTIAVTNLASDIDWALYDEKPDAGSESAPPMHDETSEGTVDETATVSLTPGATYWLITDEYDGIASSYDLRVSN